MGAAATVWGPIFCVVLVKLDPNVENQPDLSITDPLEFSVPTSALNLSSTYIVLSIKDYVFKQEPTKFPTLCNTTNK